MYEITETRWNKRTGEGARGGSGEGGEMPYGEGNEKGGGGTKADPRVPAREAIYK